jgi:FtsP/CotA-like multicopper oxidase with cupredoxin domain
MPLSRRTVVASLASLLCAGPAQADIKHRRTTAKPTRHARHLPSTEVPKLTGNPLPIPPLIEPKSGETWELKAGSVSHAFAPDKPVDVIGYNGGYPGPTIRLTRGETTKAHLVNGLQRPTNVHWHGLVVDPNADAALIPVPAGDTWETTITVDQQAATLWYHEHRLGDAPHDRPVGMMIVNDPAETALALPSTYGVDDFPLILEDRTFDATGVSVDPATPEAALIGTRGATILVNGTVDALLKVPQRLVRLRLVNAARARVFRLFMDDERSFVFIAGDGGYIAEPIEIDTLILSPGERAEIIVDFADGSTSLLSTPDDIDVHAGASGATVSHHADTFTKQFRVLAFDAVKDTTPQKPLPAQLPVVALPDVPDDARHRRFEFAIGQPGADLGGSIATINGKTFDPSRIDVAAKRGATEIWQLVAPDMPHPVHITGVQFHVLSEGGETPRAWNRGAKDTVFVESTVEVQVTFTLPSTAATPFVIESAVTEHAAAGAAATVVVE